MPALIPAPVMKRPSCTNNESGSTATSGIGCGPTPGSAPNAWSHDGRRAIRVRRARMRRCTPRRPCAPAAPVRPPSPSAAATTSGVCSSGMSCSPGVKVKSAGTPPGTISVSIRFGTSASGMSTLSDDERRRVDRPHQSATPRSPGTAHRSRWRGRRSPAAQRHPATSPCRTARTRPSWAPSPRAALWDPFRADDQLAVCYPLPVRTRRCGEVRICVIRVRS